MKETPALCVARAAPLLEAALLFTILIHAIAMVSIALLLLPGMPGGPHQDIADRAAHVAAHPRLWRLGWLPWQLTALSDLLLGLALLFTPWIRKGPALFAAAMTLAAIIPDQLGQFEWTWEGVTLAQQAVQRGDFTNYLPFESRVFALSAGWGAAGYTIGAIAWTWCYAASGIWSKWLLWLSIATWGIFAAATAIVFLPESIRQEPAITKAVSIGNAMAFILLMLWFAAITERVLRRSRPDTPFGSHAPWRHPSRGPVARLCDLVANSRLVRALGRLLPAAAMTSDITDVVYVNYLVKTSTLEHLAVPPLTLQRLGPDGRYAMFTFLTYRHGHFGPTVFGPFRRVWASPIQSNWRIYVENPRNGIRGIAFTTTAITGTLYALASRILVEGVPMHVPAAAQLRRDGDGTIHLAIEPGSGTAPDVHAALTLSPEPALPSPWNLCFKSWREMLAYCVPQDRALSAQPWKGRVTRQEIALDIPLESCRPVAGTVNSNAAHSIVGSAAPLCFLVDHVAFRFVAEQ